ncbi:hypothetical protein [Vibrio nigripulchritudo]|uniref:hypothetical protein n=1 Tax=Vibrio nigripulchritudo TaxID=28173 RepID=UPI000570124C|nr:hypothetical protein [Vibrio nigripulchritudo]
MKITNTIMALCLSLALPISSFAAELPDDAVAQTDEVAKGSDTLAAANRLPESSFLEFVIQPRTKGECFSKRKCTGKIIGHYTHAHNCRQAGGKSWLSPTTGQCSNL